VGPEEFQRALITVLGVGFAIIAVGATAVFLFLRALGQKGGGKHVFIAVGLIGFIFLCCLGLFALSYLEGR
jgi:hypothetical protein